MKTSELPLFEPKNRLSPSNEAVNSTLTNGSSVGVYEQVNSYFQQQDSDLKNIESFRDILGDSASKSTDSELASYATETLFLIEQWANDFEEQLFGKTLQELLGTK